MRKQPIYIVLFLFTFLSSCSKFTDVTPKGLIIPEKLKDYEEILNSPTLTRNFPVELFYFTDDYYTKFDQTNESPAANAYFWKEYITVNERSSPELWGPLYTRVYYCNVIINNVLKVADGRVEDRQRVHAEALVQRAVVYFDLLTVFAKAYNPATASTDYGLPMPTSTDVTEKIPARLHLQETLDYLIADLQLAAEHLPVSNVVRFRATKQAAHALLARIYLYMGKFDDAQKYNALALASPHSILDFNTFKSKQDAPRYDVNPEVLLQRTFTSFSTVALLYTDDLKSYFSSDDLRYTLLTNTNNDGVGHGTFPGTRSAGIGYPELYLTQAELLARKGNGAEAITILNQFRKKRIKTAAYKAYIYSNDGDALQKVFDERRRELAFGGIRWFDMKRLDQEGRMSEVKRVNKVNQAVEASLVPNSKNYTFEIPIRVSSFNPNMPLNHHN